MYYFFLSYNSRKQYGIFHAYIFIFNRPPQNKHFRIEFKVLLLASEGVIFRKERLSNFQISVSGNNLFDSSPALLVSICSLFPIMLRYSFHQYHFLVNLLFDSHFIGFPLLFHCTCLAVTLRSFPPSEFWAPKIRWLSIAGNPPINQ